MCANQAERLEGQAHVQNGAEPLSQSAPDGFNQAVKCSIKVQSVLLYYFNLQGCRRNEQPFGTAAVNSSCASRFFLRR